MFSGRKSLRTKIRFILQIGICDISELEDHLMILSCFFTVVSNSCLGLLLGLEELQIFN